MNQVNLGDEVRCKVTGFQGIVTTVAKHLTGCDRVAVQAPLNKKTGKMGENYWVDINAVQVLKKGKVKPESVQEEVKKGGPPTLNRDQYSSHV